MKAIPRESSIFLFQITNKLFHNHSADLIQLSDGWHT